MIFLAIFSELVYKGKKFELDLDKFKKIIKQKMKFITLCALFAFSSVNSVVLQSGRNMNIRPSEKQIDRHYENPP